MIRARVYRSAKRSFDCRIIEGGEIVSATALGNLLKDGEIVVGDYVELSIIKETGEYQISKIEKRQNETFRIIVREAKKKVTAANCDVMVMLASASKPDYKRGFVDRFLVRAYQWGIKPILIFNKMDLYDENVFDIKFEADRLQNLEVDCYELSALDDSYKNYFLDRGISELREYLKGKTALFMGQSGVGKSKLISTMSDGLVDLKTKIIGKAGKGTHTTSWMEMVDCGKFEIIDSPGVRSFSMDDLNKEELQECFPDLVDIVVQCEFNDCLHDENSKGCAFNKFFEDDSDESLFILTRLESLVRLIEEVGREEDWQKSEKY